MSQIIPIMNRPLSFSILFLLQFLCTTAMAVQFPYPFAPSEGFVNRLEKPLRDEICLNGLWSLQGAVPSPEGDMPLPGPEWDPVKIRIPSPWNANSFARYSLQGPDHRDFPSYPESWDSLRAAWLRTVVRVPSEWASDRVVIHFEAVAGKAEVYVNGRKVAENFDLFLPFEADITDVVTAGEEAEILVGVRSQKVFEEPSSVGRRLIPSGSMWGTHIAGIWQDVYLLRRPRISIDDVYIQPKVSQGVLSLKVTLSNHTDKTVRTTLSGEVDEWINRAGNDILGAPVPKWEVGPRALDIPPSSVKLLPGEVRTLELSVGASHLRTWTPESPDLYALLLRLGGGRKALDNKYERFGWREWTLRGTQLCLNGEPYSLRGDSWHFMGIPQMTRRYAWAWYTAIKGMNGNAVRPHAQVYPRFYLDMADEMGICVLDETANWASDGGPKLDDDRFWEASKDHLRRFVRRDRNHPSVFGWSISNENKPVILYVHKRPDLMPLQERAWRDWLGIVKEEDPSRPWVSSDGEEDGQGILPVTVGHYGDAASMRQWKALGKPWGVGEHSMAYYGTPLETSRYNGERSYESALGRMEALSNECYNLLRDMREEGASYSTVFNMAWYALKPLPLGKGDIHSPVTIQDGITFGPYREGERGVQPERLGPYGTTFNPGYDPSLPLFDPWPLYDAMRAANAPGGAAPSPWAEVQKKERVSSPGGSAPEPYDRVVYIGEEGSTLHRVLLTQGVVLSDLSEVQSLKGKEGRVLLVVDASSPREVPSVDADIWYWAMTPEGAAMVPGLKLREVRRSSFIPMNRSIVKGLAPSDFYFCELQRQDACRWSMYGPFVDGGEVLVEACRADWRAWNKQPEDMKTAALLRSERQCPPERAVVVRSGRITVSTLEDFLRSEKGYNTLHRIFETAGLPLTEVSGPVFGAFDDGIYQPGILTRPVN